MKELVILCEELSMKEMLREFLPKIFDDNVIIKYIVFDGKRDLRKRVSRKLKAYQNNSARFLIILDQDTCDCYELKREITQKCETTHKKFIVRIVCRELESWYLADLSAVEKGFRIPGLSLKQNKEKFRNPDKIAHAAEELQKLVPHYQKVSGSREIGKFLSITNNRSKSFHAFVTGCQKLLENDITH